MQRLPSIWSTLTVIWVLSVLTGFVVLANYKASAGKKGGVPTTWPAASRIAPRTDVANLVVAIHPRCPCSRASVEELARLLAGFPAAVAVHVLVWKPSGAGSEWIRPQICEQASRLPGATLLDDEGGEEIDRFGAVTSGHVLLYSNEGQLLFSGGVTASRGHEGGNPSLESLRLRLQRKTTEPCETLVFGCSFAQPDGGFETREIL